MCASNAVKAAVDDEKHGTQRFSHDYDMTGVLNGGAGAARRRLDRICYVASFSRADCPNTILVHQLEHDFSGTIWVICVGQ